MAARNLPQVLKRSLAGASTDWLQMLNGFTVQSRDEVLRFESRGKDPRTFYRQLTQDPRVFAVLQKRYTNVISGDLVVEPGRRKGLSATRADKKAAEMVEYQIREMGKDTTMELEERAAKAHFASGFTSFSLGMMDAILMGYSVGEIIWGRDGTECVVEEIKMRDQRRFSFVKNRDDFELHLHKAYGSLDTEPLPPRKFITYTWGSSDDPYGLGLGNRLYWPVFFKRKGLAFWGTFLEKHGIPTVWAKSNSSDPAERGKLFSAAKALMSDSVVVTDTEDVIELLEAARGAANTNSYEQLHNAMNKAITILIVGSELSTDINEGGSRAATVVHSQEEKNLAIKDGVELSNGPFQRLARWITWYNFTGDVATPIIYYRYPLQENLEEEARILDTLHNIGFRASTEAGLKYVNDKFGRGYDEPIFEYKEPEKATSGSRNPDLEEANRDREGEQNFQDERDGTDE